MGRAYNVSGQARGLAFGVVLASDRPRNGVSLGHCGVRALAYVRWIKRGFTVTIETSHGVIIGPTVVECHAEPVAMECSRASLKSLLLVAGIIVAFWVAYQALATMFAA